MNNLSFVNKFIFVFALGCFSITGFGNAAGNPLVDVDGYGELSIVRHDADPYTGNLQIIATYGTAAPATVPLTDPAIFSAYDPCLAVSKTNSATTTAVSVWQAYNLSDGSQVLQYAIADTSGWTAYSGATFTDPVNEIPQAEFKAVISDDGSIIGIVWTTYVIANGNMTIRAIYSTDGGSTWTGPFTI